MTRTTARQTGFADIAADVATWALSANAVSIERAKAKRFVTEATDNIAVASQTDQIDVTFGGSSSTTLRITGITVGTLLTETRVAMDGIGSLEIRHLDPRPYVAAALEQAAQLLGGRA